MLPEMSGLQFMVVGLLFAGPQNVVQLRQRMGASGVQISPSSFSRLMARMEAANYLYARTEQGPKGCRCVSPRQYEATTLGVALWRKARDFYASASGPPADFAAFATDEAELADLPRAARRAILARRTSRQIKRIVARFVRKCSGPRGG